MEIILRWLGIRHRAVYRADGKPDLLKRARDYAELQLARGATEVLFFFDADGPEGKSEFVHLQAALKDLDRRIHGFVPVRQLEAWLLADETALGAVLARAVRPVVQPERLDDPVGELEKLFRAAGQDYVKSRDAKRIAECSRDSRWQRCESFTWSTRTLRSPLESAE